MTTHGDDLLCSYLVDDYFEHPHHGNVCLIYNEDRVGCNTMIQWMIDQFGYGVEFLALSDPKPYQELYGPFRDKGHAMLFKLRFNS